MIASIFRPAITEVSPANTRRYTAAIGDSYKSLVTATGRSDRMMIVYNANRLEELEHAELEAHDGVRTNDENLRHRSPLMEVSPQAQRCRVPASAESRGRWQCEAAPRASQALRLWAADQELPIVGIGDYNFDFDFPTRRGNPAFDEFHLDYVWYWVEPMKLVDTNWSDRDGDGVDDYPHSCLDFTFVAGKAKLWHSRSRVIVRDGDFPDDDKTSDHRPVELVTVLR